MKIKKVLLAIGLIGLGAAAQAATVNGPCTFTAAPINALVSTRTGNTITLSASFTYYDNNHYSPGACGKYDGVPVTFIDQTTGKVLASTTLLPSNSANDISGRYITPNLTYSLKGWAAGSYKIVPKVGYSNWIFDTNPAAMSLTVTP